MGIIRAFIPTKKWLRYIREGSLAFFCAWTVAAELRDMYERSQWEPVGLQGTTSMMRTGDIVLIANRWFTLPSWPHKFYSLFSKGMMKTAWDDCGIIICDPNDNYRPYILLVEYDRVVMCRFDEFCEHRQPRGIAIRSLMSPDPSEGVKIPHMDRLEQFVKDALRQPGNELEIDHHGQKSQQNWQKEHEETRKRVMGENENNSSKDGQQQEGRTTSGEQTTTAATQQEPKETEKQIYRTPTPWKVARAAWQTNAERSQYRWAVESSELAFEIRQKRALDGATEQALAKLTDKLHERIGMTEHYEKALGPDFPRPYTSFYNASLVAEALQEAGLLTKPYPFATRYTPVDFAWRLPLVNVNLTTPKMVFTS